MQAPYQDDGYTLALYTAERCHEKLLLAGVGDVELADLEQAAILAVLEAKNNYDQRNGVKFSTFAWHHIHGAITGYLRSLDPAHPEYGSQGPGRHAVS
jgi:DNA-directed RNA polymerase specialized sigma subunit